MKTKVTRIRTRQGQWGMPMSMTLDELAAEIKSERHQQQAERLERQVQKARMDGKTQQDALKGADALPYIIFSGLYSRRGTHDFQEPTGLLLLSIDTTGDSMQTALLRHSVEQMPQTLMAFTGVSRRTLKVVVRCRPATGCLPTGQNAYLDFLRQAQQQVARYYEACTQCRITLREESLLRGCRMSHDGQLYFNPKAQPMTIIKQGMLDEYVLARTDEQGNIGSEATQSEREREQTDFYTCLTKAQETVGETIHDAMGAERLVIELAQLCRKSALPEEPAVQRTVSCLPKTVSEPIVRKIFRTIYLKLPEGRPWSQMTDKERVARKVQEFFERRYQLRYNTMKGIEEFRPRTPDYQPWQPLTDRDIHRIAHEEMMDAGAAWSIDVELYARSTMVKEYNPIHEFLAGCGRWDRRRDYISQLAKRVPCRYPEWPQLFHRWFLGMVAGWLGKSRDHGNAIVPLLVGRQGVRKSTFCKIILPHSLREYYIDDIKMDNAEQVERMLGRMALVNIDEYNAKTDREQAKIKRILTERNVQVRHMRSEHYTMTQRMASFIATTNERQPLTDTTGSRRYLCVEVTGIINTDTPINYQQLYAQAVWEIEHGEPYYMSKEDEAIMEQHNQLFINASTAEILLTSYYQTAPRDKQYFTLAADILADLQRHTKGSDRPNMSQTIKALKAAHFEYGARGGQRGWYARKRKE